MGESPLKRLHEFGQSPWLDYIERRLLRTGELQRMIDDLGIWGITSNPAIFEKAINGSEDYDDTIRQLAQRGNDAEAIYEAIAIGDVQEAADIMRPVYDDTNGADGYVSLEVSPRLAYDTDGTVAEARRLWDRLGRPNVMIKVPATPEGIPAIRTLTAEGLNINATLLFALERYREVAEAYIAGLQARAEQGEPVENIASVASFFLSRIDTLVDGKLESHDAAGGDKAAAAAQARGEVAIASAKKAYTIYKDLFLGDRFTPLAKQGAQVQRLLWASTSTKNPEYSDVKYVEPLIGDKTVNTLPINTIEAYHDHGKPAARLEDGVVEADAVLQSLPTLGIDLQAVTDQLVEEGVQKFIDPFDHLLGTIDQKREEVLAS